MSSNYRAQAGLAVHGPGPWRNRGPLTPAPSVRRWWARILDAVFVLLFSGLVIGIALALTTVNIISIDDAAKVALISYPLMALVFGALYGCTLSLGQVLCGVVTLKHSGRRVGLWRGMTRYLAVAFFPITVVLLIWILFDAPTMDLDPIDVYYRRPPQAW
ncbi:RDD family protein [Brevibacterium siliguriense]|uniref:RDD family protein n=1 Tax=Brevibacterium siliguriense TaxID=1136497 RepID=A0A1H1PHB5_9MICO|nr:RDD family protein [Brevibacterium siliguriense]SDS10636.1 RDD family protein [Brevibacterium siliguriense]